MDSFTDLLAILLLLSGLFLCLNLVCLAIERWPAFAAYRPRRAPVRIRPPRRRSRSVRPRRQPESPEDLAACPPRQARTAAR